MPTFEFKARNNIGKLESGQLEANSRAAASAQLHARGLIVTEVTLMDQRTSSSNQKPWSWNANPRAIDVELGLQQLSLMLRSGTNLLAALEALAESSPRSAARRVWQDVADSIQGGSSFSSALAIHRCFSDFTIQLIKVGEQTGHLAPVVTRAAESMKSRRSVIEEIVSALVYPLLVIAMAVGVTMYMVVYLIPKLELYLQSLGKDIPPMTQYLLNGSIWLRENYLPLTGVLLGLSLIPIILYSTRDGRLWIDRLALHVPLVGSLMRLADTAAFSRSLSLLLANGVTLIDALAIVQNLVYNHFSATIVTDARAKIIQGSNFANALDHRWAFTPMLKQMVAIGEQSGNLESVLGETAAFHEQQFLAIMRRLNALLTPVLTILIGVVVGYVYIAFFVALFAAAG